MTETRIKRKPHIRLAGMPQWRGAMTACSFTKLVQLLDKQLNLDQRLEVLEHLDSCKICRDAVYQISRDRDEAFFVHRPYNVEKNVA
jgi:predicted anti-sigma-YlaC factor YlaD